MLGKKPKIKDIAGLWKDIDTESYKKRVKKIRNRMNKDMRSRLTHHL